MALQRVLSVFLLSVVVVVSAADEPKPFALTVAAPYDCKLGQCKLNVTVTNEKGGIRFSLEAEEKEYVAVAVASSAMMGNDSVIECVKSNATDKIDVFHSTNSGPPYSGRRNARDKTQNIDKILTNITGGFKDGRIFCSFIRKPQSLGVDLLKSRYFLQIAAGDTVSQNRTNLAHHTKWATTLRSVSFVRDEGKLRTTDNIPKPASGGSSVLTASGSLLAVILISKRWIL